MPEHYKFVGEDGVDCDVPLGRVVRMPAYYPDSGFNTNSYSHLILWRPE